MARSYASLSKGIGLLTSNNHAKSTWQTIPQPHEGSSVCFEITVQTVIETDGEKKCLQMQENGFAICINGKTYAYRNHCPHVGSPLDWTPNQFFSDDGKTLLCHTHGALFDPITGACISGPCPRGLYPIPIQEDESGIHVPTVLEL